MNRRDLLRGAAALPAVAAAQTGGLGVKNIVISSANGLAACKKAREMLEQGADTLDAVVAGVNIVELDPNDNSVGYGGLPNERGVVELDASVMHGPSRRAGSVAAIQKIKTPSNIAKLVMEQSDHIMLVGKGATEFAVACGYKAEDLLTEASRMAWFAWKKSLRDPSGHSNWGEGLDAPVKKKVADSLRRMFPNQSEERIEWAFDVVARPPTGTINCLALNTKGEMSGVTSTSGLAWKIPGRVGDSPIIGAGLYVDQDVGGAGSTGRGEENIRVAGAHTIVENMRHGMSPKEACLDALKRIARNFDDDQERLARIDINFYALRKDGEYAGAALWSGRVRRGTIVPVRFAVNDGGESRHENCVWLLERKG